MHVNHLAVVVAAISTLLLGGLWYSPKLFGPAWQRAAGDTHEKDEGHPAKIFAVSFYFALLAAFAYAVLIPIQANVVFSSAQGLLVGAGVVATGFGINYQFANRSGASWLIDGGYHTLQFGIVGAILGAWS